MNILPSVFASSQQSDLSYSLGPKDDARSVPIAPVELYSKFEDKNMDTLQISRIAFTCTVYGLGNSEATSEIVVRNLWSHLNGHTVDSR